MQACSLGSNSYRTEVAKLVDLLSFKIDCCNLNISASHDRMLGLDHIIVVSSNVTPQRDISEVSRVWDLASAMIYVFFNERLRAEVTDKSGCQ